MRNVLIIGGNSDIGKSLVKYYLDRDCNVVVGYHKNIDCCDSRVKYIKCDVCNSDSIENIIKCMISMYGNIDVMVNLACVCMDSDFLDKSKYEFMRVLEVNLVGTFLCNQIYCKYIDKNKMKIVIAPYNKQTLPWLNIKDWIDLGDK